MTEPRHPVTLKGGRLDGEQRQVPSACKWLTLETGDRVTGNWAFSDGTDRQITHIQICSYRRVNETTFMYCPTPTWVGDESWRNNIGSFEPIDSPDDP